MWKAIKSFFFGRVGRKVSSASYDGQIMSVLYDNDTSELYWGNGTVWYSYPLMQRCDSITERVLCDLWTYWRFHGNPYPEAHKSQNKK